MVATPWGQSESLRDRRLRPGPGSSPAAVAANQRERLLAAMVASVAARGYAATRLSDLVEISGISSKSFYDHFPDKEGCFLATVEALIDLFSGAEGAAGFAAAVADQPAAARVCLVEAYAAGPRVRERLHAAVEDFEARARRALPPELPREVASAYVGAILELARHRLLNNTVAELPGLVADLEDQLLPAYRPPPAPLRRLTTRRPAPLTEAVDAPDHAQRIMRALTRVAAEDGYANATINRIVGEAGVSPSIFYAHFGGREEAALAAIEAAAAELLASVLPAFRRELTWTAGVRAALGALFSFLASHPALARLLFVECYAIGPAALARRERSMRPLDVLWAEGSRRSPAAHPAAVEAILGGIFHLIFKRLEEAEHQALQGLVPVATYLALCPFVGAHEAGAEAKGKQGHQPVTLDPEAIRATAAQPLRNLIMGQLVKEDLPAEELAARLDQPTAAIRHHLAELERAALITPAPAEPGGPLRYQTNLGVLHAEEWARLSPAERSLVTAQILALNEADIERARESGTLDTRTEQIVVRLPQTVDEQGWRELSELHEQTLAAASEIGARSSSRLEETGESGMIVRNLLLLFEMPQPGDD